MLKGLNAWALVSEKFTCKVKHSATCSTMDNLQGEGTVWEIEFGMEFCIVEDIGGHY